jgi:hypothetical protein
MPDVGYFMAIGGLGVSFAGFAGLITALDRRPDANPAVAQWRIHNLALDSLTITLVGFGVIAFHAITDGDLPLAIRLASGMGVVRWAFAASPKNMTGPAWDGIGRGQWWFSMSFVGLAVGAWVVSLALGSLPFFQLLMFLALFGPVTVFYNTIRDATVKGATR